MVGEGAALEGSEVDDTKSIGVKVQRHFDGDSSSEVRSMMLESVLLILMNNA